MESNHIEENNNLKTTTDMDLTKAFNRPPLARATSGGINVFSETGVLNPNDPMSPRFSLRRASTTRLKTGLGADKKTARQSQLIHSLDLKETVSDPVPNSSEPMNFKTLSEEPEAIYSNFSESNDIRRGAFVHFNRLFLSIETECKKVSYKGECSQESLINLFCTTFPQLSNFPQLPQIYIKDPILNVFYELEDFGEVVEGSILKLHLEHSNNEIYSKLDSGFSILTMEIHDLRKLMKEKNQMDVINQKRNSLTSRVVEAFKKNSAQESKPSTLSNETSSSAQGLNSKESEAMAEEIKLLKRELTTLRQTHNDFKKEAQEIIDNLTLMTTNLNKQLAEEPNSVRKLILAGKTRIEKNEGSLNDRMEELQTDLENFRLDLVKRKCKPSVQRMNHASKELESLRSELLVEQEFIATVKPTWKKTWEEELQNIVKEQMILKEYDAFIQDLCEDHKSFNELFTQLQQLTDLTRQGSFKMKYKKAVDQEYFTLDSVFQEIQCIDIDHERRLQAAEENEKARKWELQNVTNEFEEELVDFVGGRRLKKTGGTEELDRRRREQDELNLRTMLAPPPTPEKPKSDKPRTRKIRQRKPLLDDEGDINNNEGESTPPPPVSKTEDDDEVQNSRPISLQQKDSLVNFGESDTQSKPLPTIPSDE
ncbi:AIP3-domain-containing protein [Conidiobolus coronatus NRRL 28638]|uniref:AIP3-domain-containing protein n=1 Tax=Conidiobolus coronatus (strain ATCC 28846 / CBS 209.66 / NRRL 28638) TaxID=796925 RepID=A0A137NWX8_CONC2|nr:AIP3-domain-containing protein [Conidiobolus coronatus NRRL 28638]|eukprot:KXN67345.1 AIP3-domain-containing protein [Conidiobolus coronatus NRRL 28638]